MFVVVHIHLGIYIFVFFHLKVMLLSYVYD